MLTNFTLLSLFHTRTSAWMYPLLLADGPQCVLMDTSALLGQPLFHCSVRRMSGRPHFTCHLHGWKLNLHQRRAPRNVCQALTQEISVRVGNWLGRSNKCLLSSARVTSSGMGHSTKFAFFWVTFQGIWIEAWDFVWAMYYTYNCITSSWLLKNQEVWQYFWWPTAYK